MSPAGREGDIGVNSELSVGAIDSLAVVAVWDRVADADVEELGVEVATALGTTGITLAEDDTTGLGMAMLELEDTELAEAEAECVTAGTLVDDGELSVEADGIAKTAVRAGGAVDMIARPLVEVGPSDVAVFS